MLHSNSVLIIEQNNVVSTLPADIGNVLSYLQQHFRKVCIQVHMYAYNVYFPNKSNPYKTKDVFCVMWITHDNGIAFIIYGLYIRKLNSKTPCGLSARGLRNQFFRFILRIIIILLLLISTFSSIFWIRNKVP